MNSQQFNNLYDPVNQGYIKHKQKQYQDWHDERPYTEELFWNTLVHLGWRQDHKEQRIGNKTNLITQLVLECPDCSKAIKTINIKNIGQENLTTVSSLFTAKEDLEKHKNFYCQN